MESNYDEMEKGTAANTFSKKKGMGGTPGSFAEAISEAQQFCMLVEKHFAGEMRARKSASGSS